MDACRTSRHYPAVGDEQKFHIWWYRVGGFAVFGFMAASMLAWLNLFWPMALLFVPFAWLAVRLLRVGVVFTDDRLIIRGAFRTKSAPWTSVEQVRDSAGSSTGLPWRVPEFVLDEASWKAEEVRTLRRESSIVDAVVESGRARIGD